MSALGKATPGSGFRQERAPRVLISATTVSVRGEERVSLEAAYTSALVEVGLLPLILPPTSPELAGEALHGVSALVLPGGAEDVDPSVFGEARHPLAGASHLLRDRCEIALAAAAYARGIPTLAICRGAQIMNIAMGGSLIQDVDSQLGVRHPRSAQPDDRVHEVEVEGGSRFAGIVNTRSIRVNSSHHQAIGRLGSRLRVIGRSGDGVVEVIESADPAWWMVGVQWHPESLTQSTEDWDRALFRAFADVVRAASGDQ